MAEKGTLHHHVLSCLSDRARAKQTKRRTTRPQLPPRWKKKGQRSEHSNRPEQRPKARNGKRGAYGVETGNLGGARKGAWEGGLFLFLTGLESDHLVLVVSTVLVLFPNIKYCICVY